MKFHWNMHRFPFFSLILLISVGLHAQDFAHLQYRELGPYRGGRVTAVAGTASAPSTFFMGATGGGVWKTEDAGLSWRNVSDGFFSTPSIGALEIAQDDPNIVWAGTGSDGLRSNVIEGRGVYKSIDGGEHWTFAGLREVGQIGTVRIHPDNHNIVFVAAIGKAFRPNQDRGVFRTTDGGKTWEKVLYVSEQTGFYDLEFHPTNPEIVFATAWKAERKPWTIISGGRPEEGGIYKSIDGGRTWEKVERGLPTDLIGKIDLAVTPADSRIVYALVEAPGDRGGLYKSVDQGLSFTHVSSHRGIRTRPFYYTNLRVDPRDPDKLYALATGYYRSDDGGKNWTRISSPHGDNHDMWINPEDPDIFIQSNDGGANITHNGGKSWTTQFNQPTAEIYQVEVDDQYPYWLYGGQQDNSSTIAVPSQAPYGMQQPGTGYIIHAGGCETGPAVPKPGNPNIVYANCKGRFGVYNKLNGTEMQFYVGASNMYGHNPKDLKYRFQRVSPIHVSPHNPDVVYHCSQYVHRTTDDGRTWETISPDLTAFEPDKQTISGEPITRDITGEEFYSTIYALRESPLKEGLIWIGANDGPVHVTRDGGQNWEDVTPRRLPEGGRVDAVEPSPHNPAKAYVSVLRYQLGDPRPYIYRTDNYGRSWTLLTDGENGIPADVPTRVVREDPVREGLLYAGTEYGMFVSFDDGSTWQKLQQNLPVTPVTDIKIFRGDLALSTMGRGFWVLEDLSSLRQIKMPLTAHQLFTPKDTYRYRYPSGARSSDTPDYPRSSVKVDYYLATDLKQPVQLLVSNSEGEAVYRALSTTAPEKGPKSSRNMGTEEIRFVHNEQLETRKGFHRFRWFMEGFGAWNPRESRAYRNGPMVPPGTYTLTLSSGDWSQSVDFELLMDPRTEAVGVSSADLKGQSELQTKVLELMEDALRLEEKLKKELKQATGVRKTEIESALARLQTEEGIYMQPKILAQISYLYSMINRADQPPGSEAESRYTELTMEFKTLSKRFD